MNTETLFVFIGALLAVGLEVLPALRETFAKQTPQVKVGIVVLLSAGVAALSAIGNPDLGVQLQNFALALIGSQTAHKLLSGFLKGS